MQHAIINAMKCMRAIKDRIARPVYQLENHLNQPLYPHGVSTGEIIGTSHQSASHNVACNQIINESVNQARDNDVASSSATGSSTQQLVIQLAQFLTTQQLIALQLRSETTTHHSFATVPLTRVDV
ncbi:hypothetical protein F511_22634 [Dorcoceras hygrometricum]|uniref:Uncharacterized protein n=1 Tax=Dorcoceras hygrometricum TaxID=472368 RepID=A0A2Z7CSI3_9LAMI|nr:hypothetical protein F511_22634 [Dorcoceras hygrometricum]